MDISKDESITIKINFDNSNAIKALDKIEKKVDLIQNKMNQLISTIENCNIPTDSNDSYSDSRFII
ncbi:MAG: hypothetical protein K2I80_03125 [Ruminococcus sp.]|nr:hypothetical protein [Ruminococcus sp.]